MALHANDAMSSYRPYSHHWLDSAVQETLLPGSPWQGVYDKLSQALAKRIHPELGDPDRRAAIFDLLGTGFRQKYLSKWTWETPTKNTAKRTPEEQRAILQSTQVLLKEKLDLAARDCGYLVPKKSTDAGSQASSYDPPTSTPWTETGDRALPSPQPPPQDPSSQPQVPVEVIDTISAMASIFRTGMHRYLVQEGIEGPSTTESEDKRLELTHLTSVNANLLSEKTNDGEKSGGEEGEEEEKKEEEDYVVPNCWGRTSNLLGQSLCAILRRDAGRLDEVCKKLTGRQLPGSLRCRVWNMVMLCNYKAEAEGEKSSEWFLRKNFAKSVLRGKAEMRIESVTKSPIDGLLEKAVQEKYKGTPCMLKHRDQVITREAREALNVLYVFDRSYQPYYIHWLYPLQLALADKNTNTADTTDDGPYELALQLHLLKSHTFPRWSEILAVAQNVMADVEQADADFYAHLVRCSKTNVRLDPKDFLVHQIQDEHQKASSLTTNVSPVTMAADDNREKEMLASPSMFLRKWLGEGFVGVCDTQAVLYIWDQCFMDGWSHEVLHRVSLSLLMLLRESFMVLAQDYHVMKKIFLGTPCRLYTHDIQRAYQHLQNGGDVSEIPPLNRRPVEMPKRKAPKVLTPTEDTDLQLPTFPDLTIPSTPPPLLPTNQPQETRPQPIPQDTPIAQAPPIPTSPAPLLAPPPPVRDDDEPVLELDERQAGIDAISEPSPQGELNTDSGDMERRDTSPPLQRVPSDKDQDLSSPRPAVTPPPQDPEPVWVTFDPSTTSDLPPPPSPRDGFDLYVDGVRFLPDNATIAKVTGRFLNTVSPIDLSAQPDMTSVSLRACPKFTHRTLVHDGKLGMLVKLRVHTVDRVTHEVVTVGTCILPVYNSNDKKLNMGGHQLALHSGFPTPGQPVIPQSVDHLPRVPGCSLLIRLLPHSEEFLEAPPYYSGFYQSESCKPNDSETNVIKHYKAGSDWRNSEKIVAIELAGKEEKIARAILNQGIDEGSSEEEKHDEWSVMSNVQLQRWAMTRLDDSSETSGGTVPPLLDLVRCVNYSRETGLVVKLRMAHGLQAENRYSVVLTRIVPGPKAKRLAGEHGDGVASRPEMFLTKRQDMDSLMQAPRWKDRPRVLHPLYDKQSILLVQFFGLEVTYQIDPSGRTKGMVKGPKRSGAAKLDPSSYLGWGVLPLFYGGCVAQGTYVMPIFQDMGNWSFLKGRLEASSLESWMRQCLERKTIRVVPGHPSAIISLWDAHFYQGQTVPLPKIDDFLHLAGDQKLFAAAAQKKTGSPLSQIVIRSLPSIVQQEGTTGQRYLKEQENFQEVMPDLATELMENALLTTGQTPLTD